MLDEIKVFVAVVQAGSFTDAAENLGAARSVISKKVSRLEESLGVRLLNRTTRRLSLTEAGDTFFRRCGQSLLSIQEAVDEIRSLNSEPRGRLFVNLPMSFGILQVAPLMPEFIQRYPGIQLDLNFDDQKVEMVDPGFDVSIRISDLQDSSLAARYLGTCRHVVVAAESYLKKYGSPDTPLALAHGHVIASYRLQDSAQEWEFKDSSKQSLKVRVQPELIANNSLAIKEIVLGGAALARMPTFIVGQDLHNGKLQNVFPDLDAMNKSIYAVFPKRKHLPNKTRVFIEYLIEKIGDGPCWDLGPTI